MAAIRLKTSASLDDVPVGRERKAESPLSSWMWRARAGSETSALLALTRSPQPDWPLDGVVRNPPGGEAPADPHYLRGDVYLARAFTAAKLSNVVVTRDAKAIGAAGIGFLDEFNVSGGLGIPRDLLGNDLTEAADSTWLAERATLERVPGYSIPLGHYGFETFGHFVLDGLLQIFLHEGALQSGAARLVHWPLSHPWMEPLLERCGATQGRRFTLSAPVGLLQSAGLSSALAGHGVYFPGNFSAPFFDWLRRRLVGTPGPAKRLYIRRGPGYGRQILNQPDLERWLEAREFLIVDPQEIDVARQAELFAGAETAISAWGSGLTLAPLLAGRRNVIELLPETVTDPWFLRQAAVHGLSLSPLVQPATPQGDIAVDLERLERLLAQVLA